MNQTQRGGQRTMTAGKPSSDAAGTPVSDAVPPGNTAAHEEAVGRVPPEENRKHPSDPLKPGDEDEYGTRLEKVLSKIEPPGREVPDHDITDPGSMTPDAPPVDNRS